MTSSRTSQALLVSELERAVEAHAPADLVDALDWLRTADRTRDVDDWCLAYANAEHVLAMAVEPDWSAPEVAAALDDVPACVGAADDAMLEAERMDREMDDDRELPRWVGEV